MSEALSDIAARVERYPDLVRERAVDRPQLVLHGQALQVQLYHLP